MKSNVWVKKLTNAFVIFAWFGLAPAAFADPNANSGDEDQTNPLSEIGIERGLELYPKDRADTCVSGALQIRVTVLGVKKEGILKLELFGEEDFLKKKGKLRRIRVPAEDAPQRVCINLPHPGEYAVVGYHDEDGDRRLKKAWNFKPKEPYGLSNNPDIKSLRLPKFSETKFFVPMEGVEIDIQLVDLS